MNPLVGRDHILSVLGTHLDAALQGVGNCVVVDGPFGIGKTHLLKATAMEAAERGLTVVAGRASLTNHPIPIHLLINFLRHVQSDASDFDDLTRPDRNPFWLMDHVGGLVDNAARRHPLVVVLDDAQRIDDISALALRGLVQSLSSAPVLWLLARRPVASPSLAQHAVDWLIGHAAVRLHLGALDDEAVVELCTGILGAKPDTSVLSWAARCGGNPWLMENVFSALIKAGQMIIADGSASVVAERLPDGIRTAVRDLLDGMSPKVRRLLVEGRRLGSSFTVDNVAALLGEPATNLSTDVEEAVQVGLLLRDGVGLTFAQQMVGDALQQAADPDSAPITVAEARSLWSAPMTSSSSSDCGCDATAARVMAHLAGRFEETPATVARALRLLAGAGCGTEACHLANVVLFPGVDAAAEAHLVLELAQGLRDGGKAGMAADRLHRTLERDDLCELDQARVKQLAAETAKRMSGGRRKVQAASLHRSEACRRPLWTWLVRALHAADAYEEAEAVLVAVEQEADKTGAALRHGHRAEFLAAAGWLDDAGAEAETALHLAADSPPEDLIPARIALAHISMHRGDLATASDQLRTTERLLLTGEPTADKARLDWALAQFHAASGRPAMTVQTLIAVDGQIAPDPLLFTEVPTAAATLVRHARQAGLGAEAERAAEFARRIAQRNPHVQSLSAGAEHAEGLLRNDPVALHRAADLHRLAGRPLAAASALEDAARIEPGLRDKTRAVRLLESAMDLYLECGASGDLDRTQRKVRRLDAHNVRRLSPERPKSGWESLTSAELRVIRAIVDGRTNREAASALFLSPHTVDSHLRRVFSKLEINSRVELTKHFLAHEAFRPVPATPAQPVSAG